MKGIQPQRTPSRLESVIKLSDFQSILSNLSFPTTPSVAKRQAIDLAQVLTSEAILDSVEKKAERLMPHLPEEPIKKDVDELKTTINSPEFRLALNEFGGALQSGAIGAVLKHFNCSQKVVASAHAGGETVSCF